MPFLNCSKKYLANPIQYEALSTLKITAPASYLITNFTWLWGLESPRILLGTYYLLSLPPYIIPYVCSYINLYIPPLSYIFNPCNPCNPVSNEALQGCTGVEPCITVSCNYGGIHKDPCCLKTNVHIISGGYNSMHAESSQPLRCYRSMHTVSSHL
jgi:hypothetical protein